MTGSEEPMNPSLRRGSRRIRPTRALPGVEDEHVHANPRVASLDGVQNQCHSIAFLHKVHQISASIVHH
ncbi:hypothetical protein QJS10_CPB12g01076 [Acorus calamus]|uniref:Uncharacterized protein n=1 Tax=Acorus calamus TaxID=4465 RepID=A0AAV9DMA6_ACOCL|nr:hypothetical protein QJS10_CPB12g01076 [Acorus calamus]